MIKIVGRTDPFFVTLLRDDKPFKMDEFYKIKDSENNMPVCRIIKSESFSVDSVSCLSRDIVSDILNLGLKTKVIYLANAKIENELNMPVHALSDVVYPKFSEIKDFIIKADIDDSFHIGEVIGTDNSVSIPEKYTKLFLLKKHGKIQEQTAIPLLFNYKKMYESPHIGLFGGSGSGKTFALKVIAEECMKKKIPVIMMDPHLEMNFKDARDDIPEKYKYDFKNDFEIFRVGKEVGINFSELTAEELINIINFAAPLTGPMESIIEDVFEFGNSYDGFKIKIETLLKLKDLSDMKKLDIKSLTSTEKDIWTKHSDYITSSASLHAILWRLNSINSVGIFEKDTTKVESALKNRKLCVLRGDMKALNILGAYLLKKIYEKRKRYVDSKELHIDEEYFPPFFAAMDEAHIFCPGNSETSPIKSLLKTISQEGRKYGVFEIMATQRPSLLDQTIVSQMSSKFIFKLSIKEDLASVAKETDLSQTEIERLPYLNSGETFISSTLFGKTLPVRIRYTVTKDKSKINPFDEFNKISKENETLISLLPFSTIDFGDIISKMIRMGYPCDVNSLKNKLYLLKDMGYIKIDKKTLTEKFYK